MVGHMKAAGFMSAVLGFVSRSATGRRTQASVPACRRANLPRELPGERQPVPDLRYSADSNAPVPHLGLKIPVLIVVL